MSETIDFSTGEVTRENVRTYRKTAIVKAGSAIRGGVIPTLEGDHTFEAGDYIAGPGAAGEFWPIRRDIFEATYAEAEASAEPGALRAALDEVYTLLVSSIPALYRSWNQSPNETAERLNGLLYARVTEWVTEYQRATGRPIDSYPLALSTSKPRREDS